MSPRTHMETADLLARISAYALSRGLSMKAMAGLLGVPESTYYGWFKKGSRKVAPSPSSVDKLRRFLSGETPVTVASGTIGEARGRPGAEGSGKPAHERARRVKQLLILLESELSVFRDGPRSVREVFRAELDPDDVGYISSLLTMLGDENKFVRWRDLTTNRFHRFGEKKKEDVQQGSG